MSNHQQFDDMRISEHVTRLNDSGLWLSKLRVPSMERNMMVDTPKRTIGGMSWIPHDHMEEFCWQHIKIYSSTISSNSSKLLFSKVSVPNWHHAFFQCEFQQFLLNFHEVSPFKPCRRQTVRARTARRANVTGPGWTDELARIFDPRPEGSGKPRFFDFSMGKFQYNPLKK